MTAKVFQRLTITRLNRVSKTGESYRYAPATKPVAFEVMFNPNTYSIEKSVAYDLPRDKNGEVQESDRKHNAPTRTFSGGGGRTVTMELFFDTTEEQELKPKPLAKLDPKKIVSAAASPAAGQDKIPSGDPLDVRQSNLAKLVALAEIAPDAAQTPPPVWLTWGGKDLVSGGTAIAFVGVLTSLSQRFTLFAPDGRPLRAFASVRFEELLDREGDKRTTDPDFTTQVLRRGESLASIAAEQYGDPAVWRLIAEANHLDDPRQLPVGSALALPKTS